MTDVERKTTIDLWHRRADAYETLIRNYRIFIDMAMDLIKLVGTQPTEDERDMRVMDLAAGTGLVSKLLVEHRHLSLLSLYLIEPAERMCRIAQQTLPSSQHIYQVAAEDCLSLADLPRNGFDFILCNASMHLMSEDRIFPIVSQLLKPGRGCFLYTLWYHAFDETQHADRHDEFEALINDVLTECNYPKYFPVEKSSSTATTARPARSRKYLEETARQHGLRLDSCTIRCHQVPMEFDLDFLLMTPGWLDEHLKNYEWTQTASVQTMKEKVAAKVREAIQGKCIDTPIVTVAVSREN